MELVHSCTFFPLSLTWCRLESEQCSAEWQSQMQSQRPVGPDAALVHRWPWASAHWTLDTNLQPCPPDDRLLYGSECWTTRRRFLTSLWVTPFFSTAVSLKKATLDYLGVVMATECCTHACMYGSLPDYLKPPSMGMFTATNCEEPGWLLCGWVMCENCWTFLPEYRRLFQRR